MCGVPKFVSHYRSRGGEMSHLLKSRCNQCLHKEHKRWVENNPVKVREYRDKDPWTLVKRCSRRNITPEQLIYTYEKQEGCCAICKKEIEIINSAIDHNHKTEEFRGILCKQCNRGLGMFLDSPLILRNALEYLEDLGFYGED
jgi:hypothetical protein